MSTTMDSSGPTASRTLVRGRAERAARHRGIRRLRRAMGWFLAMLLGLFAPCPAVEAARQSEVPAALEYEVKAAFLFNFARFVEWPGVPETRDRTFTIGILGPDPFGEILDRTVAGKTFNGQAIAVRRLRDPKDATTCRILFIGRSEDRRLPEILETLRGAPVLTVTEIAPGTRDGGVIRFFMEDRGVRFEIDLDAAARAGLKISSRLLSVARVVRDPAVGGR